MDLRSRIESLGLRGGFLAAGLVLFFLPWVELGGAGYSGFTVGQRKGLGGGLPERYYVLEIRPESRQVVVGPRRFLDVRGACVGDVNWLASPPLPGTKLLAQVRYRSPPHPCRVVASNGTSVELRFEQPARAVTPGQSSVFFDGDRVIGGGRISRVTGSGY